VERGLRRESERVHIRQHDHTHEGGPTKRAFPRPLDDRRQTARAGEEVHQGAIDKLVVRTFDEGSRPRHSVQLTNPQLEGPTKDEGRHHRHERASSRRRARMARRLVRPEIRPRPAGVIITKAGLRTDRARRRAPPRPAGPPGAVGGGGGHALASSRLPVDDPTVSEIFIVEGGTRPAVGKQAADPASRAICPIAEDPQRRRARFDRVLQEHRVVRR